MSWKKSTFEYFQHLSPFVAKSIRSFCVLGDHIAAPLETIQHPKLDSSFICDDTRITSQGILFPELFVPLPLAHGGLQLICAIVCMFIV
jgi:hypothetical protein